jgi:signal transduction histidine kinase
LFVLLTSAQYALIREGGKNQAVRILLMVSKVALSFGSALFFKGLGPFILFCVVVFDICLACPAIWSGVLSAVGICAFLVITGGSRDMILIRIVLAAIVYLLAYVVKKEELIMRSTVETISSLRVSEKKLQDTNQQIELYHDKLADAARMQERTRIAKGIHDTLGHMLTAITVQLSAALQMLGQDDDAARRCVQNARSQAKGGLDSIRETIHMLDDTGASFASRLKGAMEAAEKSMQIQVLAIIDPGVEPREDIQQYLLSSLKEGLTNGVRHGRATAFVFKLEKVGGNILFYLEDNGVGCAELTKGFGLTAMEEIAEQSGGSSEAFGMPDGGFYLRITLPDTDVKGA